MRKFLSLVMMAAFASIAMAQQTIQVTVENPTNAPRTDQPVVMSLAQYGQVQSALVKTGDEEIPCQLDDLNQDDTFDELCFLADLKAKEKKPYTVTLYAEGEPRQYPARVFAELLVRNSKVKEKNKHNNFLESITARGDCADIPETPGTAGDAVLYHQGAEGRRLWRRCAVGRQHLRIGSLPRLGWSAAHDDRPRSQSHPAHHLLRSPAYHRRTCG